MAVGVGAGVARRDAGCVSGSAPAPGGSGLASCVPPGGGWIGMGGAGAVTVGDGRQTLHVRAEEFGEDRGLRLTQLRELGGDMCHRAVVLTDLQAGPDLTGVGGVPGAGQRVGDLLDGVGHRHRVRARTHIGDDAFDALPGEFGNRIGTAEIAELAHRRAGQVVVRVPHLATTGRRQLEVFGGTSAAAPAEARRGDLDVAGALEGVEVTTDTDAEIPRRSPMSPAVSGPSSTRRVTTASRV